MQAGVAPHISVSDVLPMPGLSRVTIRAYKNLHTAGQIAIQFPICVRGDTVTINYLSPLPADWIHQTIADTAAQGRKLLEAERDKIAARLEMLLEAEDGGRTDLSGQIETALSKYREIVNILR